MLQVEYALMVTVIVLLFSAGIWLGKLWGDVRNNRKDIEDNKKEFNEQMKCLRNDNKADHNQIFNEIKSLNNFVRNGKGS